MTDPTSICIPQMQVLPFYPILESLKKEIENKESWKMKQVYGKQTWLRHGALLFKQKLLRPSCFVFFRESDRSNMIGSQKWTSR